jgi:V/A-type H+-transporting ATPase subunit C
MARSTVATGRTRDDAANPEYVTARVRSRRAALFGEEDYRKLLRMEPSEIARFMEDSTYEDAINALGARHSGVDLIEYALADHLAARFDDLLRWADGSLYERIASYLRKFDAWNLKTALRGAFTDADREDIATDYVRAGEFDDALLDTLAAAESVDAVIDAVADTRFGPPLEDARDDYEEGGALVPLENAVDRAFYEGLLAEASGDDAATELYVEFLQAEIDFRNLRNALRIARSGADIDPSAYHIDGGRLFAAADLARLARSPEDIESAVRESTYADDLADALDDLDAAESLVEFENALEHALVTYAVRLSNRYPLSICPVLAYVVAVEREVQNVRAIARGKEAGLSREELEAELVIA